MAALVPFDCPALEDPKPLPIPQSALQGNYTNSATGQDGVGMILKYKATSASRNALKQYRAMAQTCGDRQLALVKSGSDFAIVTRYDALMPKAQRTGLGEHRNGNVR